MKSVIIAPSILSADLLHLRDQVTQVLEEGIEWIHVDIMDGHFVPNLTFGPNMVEAVRRAAPEITLDVHLMISDPDDYLADFRSAGADILTVHVETCPHLYRTLERIGELGARKGATLNPATPVDSLRHVVNIIDLLLVMTVEPGFGGQPFVGFGISKVSEARRLLDSRGSEAFLEVDGGIDPNNAGSLVRAGADVLVAGSSIFGHVRPQEGVQALQRTVGEALKIKGV